MTILCLYYTVHVIPVRIICAINVITMRQQCSPKPSHIDVTSVSNLCVTGVITV